MRIAHNLGILLITSNCFAIFFSGIIAMSVQISISYFEFVSEAFNLSFSYLSCRPEFVTLVLILKILLYKGNSFKAIFVISYYRLFGPYLQNLSPCANSGFLKFQIHGCFQSPPNFFVLEKSHFSYFNDERED